MAHMRSSCVIGGTGVYDNARGYVVVRDVGDGTLGRSKIDFHRLAADGSARSRRAAGSLSDPPALNERGRSDGAAGRPPGDTRMRDFSPKWVMSTHDAFGETKHRTDPGSALRRGAGRSRSAATEENHTRNG